jgi:phospholipid-binding lipoprotein MlaA
MFKILKKLLILTVLGLSIAGCQKPHSPDRFECFNRPVYAFNKAADRVVLKPAARIYQGIIPKPLRLMVSNFFQNLNEIPSMGNDLLQGNFAGFRTDASRFLINSTWGMGGLVDLAATRGFDPRKQDFGLTLARWGYQDSSYVVLPFLGPSTVRDGIGRVGTYYMGVPAYLKSVRLRNSLLGLNFIDTRASLLKIDPALSEAVDEYIFVREAYLQNRQAQISASSSQGLDGNTATTVPVLSEPPE